MPPLAPPDSPTTQPKSPKALAGGQSTAARTGKTTQTVDTSSPSNRSKVILVVGVGLAFALANTQAAPLVITLLAGGIIYQLVNLA